MSIQFNDGLTLSGTIGATLQTYSITGYFQFLKSDVSSDVTIDSNTYSISLYDKETGEKIETSIDTSVKSKGNYNYIVFGVYPLSSEILAKTLTIELTGATSSTPIKDSEGRTIVAAGQSLTITLKGDQIVYDVLNDGTGIAFGKTATDTLTLDSAWKIHCDVLSTTTIDSTTITNSGEISTGSLKVNEKSLLDLTYPVGSIYMSVNNTSPADLFGGTWKQIQDTFLLSAGSTYTAGSTGGEATHTLTKDELPKHRHPFGNMDGDNLYAHLTTDGSTASDQSGALSGSTYKVPHSAASATYTHRSNTDYTGSGAAHNNMPPYLVVYMWQRMA